MKGFRRVLYFFLIFILILFTSFFAVTIYNNISFLKNFPSPGIETISRINNATPSKTLKVLSYNIHFGTGVNDSKINSTDRPALEEKLNIIAKILSDADADIVFLQEVDIDSSRSFRINQGKSLAEKAGYNYYAFATYWYRKIFPDINGRHGFLNHGLCILSKYPLMNHKAQVFEIPKTIPFFLRWLFNPHGAQKIDVAVGNEQISLINLHLDPWSPFERELQIRKIFEWVKISKKPIIIGGDFNTEPAEVSFKSTYHLKDKPWFLKIDQEKLQNEKTLIFLQENRFTSSVAVNSYLESPQNHYSYPSFDPQVKLDYIFVNQKFKIIESGVIKALDDGSDHLPIYVILKLRSQQSSDNTK